MSSLHLKTHFSGFYAMCHNTNDSHGTSQEAVRYEHEQPRAGSALMHCVPPAWYPFGVTLFCCCCCHFCCLSLRGPAQDGLVPALSPLFSPFVPYDVYTPNPSNPEMTLESHLEEIKETSDDFSSVDLIFLPDELTQENRNHTVIKSQHETEENSRTQNHQNKLPLLSKQDVELGFQGSSLSNPQAHLCPGPADSALPSPENPSPHTLPLSIAPMTPVAPASECSGIVPQLQ